ncbi:hypothetical protein DYB28_007053 [Aphanomyces astaci]|uniref:Leucine-rich repeat-containing N-terminal plant-type domain-containing protein n=1 Tax=Aphanomyces astaci TaxID=112090 RepID=A0A9X8HC29_APHAT|nr:hypothetical protein DYB28_007053 [Aphanomyces astaci]
MPAILALNPLHLSSQRGPCPQQDIPLYSYLYQLALSGIGLSTIPDHIYDISTMANFEADYNDLTEVPLELVSLASLRTISLMYNGTAGSLHSNANHV